jgi:ATP-dependent Lon protease
VKDQLLRIDSTYPEVRFAYEGKDGQEKLVHTLEEDEYPNKYHRRLPIENQSQPAEATPANTSPAATALEPSSLTLMTKPRNTVDPKADLKEQHLVFQENQRGVSFDALFGLYLAGAKRIVITDPYMRMFHQVRNLMDLMETISKFKGPDEEVAVHAVTVEDEFNGDRQSENLKKLLIPAKAWGFSSPGLMTRPVQSMTATSQRTMAGRLF